MPNDKRIDLGFDDDSSSSDVEAEKYKRRSKLPKLSFKFTTPESVTQLPTDKSQVLAQDQSTKSNNSCYQDYLSMVITEDDLTKPQRLQSKKDQPPTSYDFESIKDEGSSISANSLFGKVTGIEPPEAISTVSLKSKGLSIMEKMGFKIGDTLGIDSANSAALLEPIQVRNLCDRAVIGNNKKEQNMSKEVTEEDTKLYRERLHNKTEDLRKEKIIHRMQKYCYEFSLKDDVCIKKLNPLDVNVLWRGYVKFIQNFLADKKKKSSKSEKDISENSDSLTQISPAEESNHLTKFANDEELELFEELGLEEKIDKLNIYLRSNFNYCYFCGIKFLNQGDLFENCPGVTEDEHN
ncbi:hypothetical protein WICMUC_004322 [Wickerhamomyces mucosus]|uniref:G-patch domain-containing protein n=1 Tax=Wickerhamomyces mucosus TaxID=1378264 RepID=A0A9P8TBF5_9ASCO|nr:hypothetical protein WICMUC_004322 [Wickerhamomyces mucosus]